MTFAAAVLPLPKSSTAHLVAWGGIVTEGDAVHLVSDDVSGSWWSPQEPMISCVFSFHLNTAEHGLNICRDCNYSFSEPDEYRW